MTHREIGNILNGNEVTNSLVRIYNMRKFLKLDHMNYPTDMTQFSSAEDYFRECVLDGLDNYAKTNPKEYVIGARKSFHDNNKENFLNNFSEDDRELMSKYWDGTIGYADDLMEGLLTSIIDKYINVRAELDEKIYSNCAIPTFRFAEAFASKIREDEDIPFGIGNIDLSKYRWASSLPGSVKYIDRRGNRYCVVLSEQPKLGNYLDLALQGEKGYHFLGNADWYINPFTYELLFNPSVKYNRNILTGFNVENKVDMAKLEVIAEYVREHFHEVPFCKFVHFANGLEELISAYQQVEKIFVQDYNNLMSDKMIKKQKKFFKIDKNDASKLIEENIEEFQSYFNNVFYDIVEWHEKEADKKFLMGETPFPEFD